MAENRLRQGMGLEGRIEFESFFLNKDGASSLMYCLLYTCCSISGKDLRVLNP